MEFWLEEGGHSRGAVVSFEQMWALVQPWYAERLSSDWRGRSAEAAQSIITAAGLRGDFWNLL